MSSVPSGWAIVSLATPTAIMRAAARSANGLLMCGDADWSQRCEGLCTLQVSVGDLPTPAPDPALVSNGKLVLQVDYRAGQAGGRFLADIPRGGQMTVGASDVVSVAAFWEPVVAGAPLVIPGPQRVDVSAHWSTSKGGVPAIYTPPGVAAGVFVPVPAQGRMVSAMAATAAGLAGVTFEFATSPNAGSVFAAATVVEARLADAVPVPGGARFVRFAGAAGVVFPVFQLWT